MSDVVDDIDTNSNTMKGDAYLGEPDMDALDRARHVWKKGRFEFMGGPIYFTQGCNTPGYDNNERVAGYGPMSVFDDPVARKLGVDTTEQ